MGWSGAGATTLVMDGEREISVSAGAGRGSHGLGEQHPMQAHGPASLASVHGGVGSRGAGQSGREGQVRGGSYVSLFCSPLVWGWLIPASGVRV